jgi:hypothetical protein
MAMRATEVAQIAQVHLQDFERAPLQGRKAWRVEQQGAGVQHLVSSLRAGSERDPDLAKQGVLRGALTARL